MYLGCQMYSAFDKSAIQSAKIFCHEAEALWEKEQTHDSYMTMASAVVLSLCLIGHGKDHAVHSYAKKALSMGTRLGLFESEEEPVDKKPLEKMSQDDLTARCHAAWGVFNWNVLISMFYRQPGSECPVSSPTLPIPGDEAAKTAPGELPEDGHSVHEALPGNTFPALCHFWRIINGARWIYYQDEACPPDRLKMAIAEHKFRELIAWAEGLSRRLTYLLIGDSIWLHCIMLDIFRRFMKRSSDDRFRMATFSAWDSSPDAAFAASVNQLKTLIVEYRTNYMASAYSILWHSGLMYLANAMLRDTSDPEWRLYFLLCIYGYESLSRPYRISEVIAQGLLSMTLRDTNMSASEARKIMEDLHECGLDHVKKNMEEEVRATFALDLTLALSDPAGATVENMAKEFDSFATFQDFLDQNKMEM
ncbi:hypothetical protein DL766_002864 [Monosporascus sp. MC13-8B]|uniref:Transcription factor domain-containing protein n=1 Tax=Monosporascus cannonballus TaxID=155416 RepID=A0ABY0HH98_9PEZI|nr:hypothetical protein DL762_002550 [Monosporascus cannonballus]RYO95195.1 hypothetical protein DL763_003763 [Monosporascus cannonballus]RYP34673.1 hypothetical protein DL766_002864 [Monosporascus sp. MC13-8B]